ncbi:MAG TPA: glycosyltransferase family A protein [Trinickia sp.]|nr:glycosyltransferase family A protein [Trinickia sp.]
MSKRKGFQIHKEIFGYATHFHQSLSIHLRPCLRLFLNYLKMTNINDAKTDIKRKIGLMIPTHGRPDFLRNTVLQLAFQTVTPDVICIHQNGDEKSYEWVLEDLNLPCKIIWIFNPSKLKQHAWYSAPLRRLIEEHCTHFFWIDHDDIYLTHHIKTAIDELVSHDFRIASHADLLYVHKLNFSLEKNIHFTAHGPKGMSSSMAFNRAFAVSLCFNLETDEKYHYSDNVVSEIVMPMFNCFHSPTRTTIYRAHSDSLTSHGLVARWYKNLDNEAQ